MAHISIEQGIVGASAPYLKRRSVVAAVNLRGGATWKRGAEMFREADFDLDR
jgi:hypothetical protein